MPTSAESMDLTDRLLYLRSIAVLASLPAADLVVIARTLRERTYADGEAMVRKDEAPGGLLLVASGRVRLSHLTREVGTVEAPCSVGFHALLARSMDGFEAAAIGETRVLSLDADAVLELIEDHIPILFLSLKSVAQNLLGERKANPKDFNVGPPGAGVQVPARPMDIVERIFYLRTMNAFKRASVNAVAAMCEHLGEVRYAPGETIWKIGDPVELNLLMVSGSIVCTDPQGRTFRYGAGGAVGGLEAFAGARRWYDAVADAPIVALRTRQDDLFDMFEDNHELAFDFLAMLAADLLDDWVKKVDAGQVEAEMLKDLRVFGAGLPLV